MKIQTQARILMISIVAVPLFVIISHMAYRQFLSEDVISGLPVNDNVSEVLAEYIDPQKLDSISRNVIRFRQFGDIVIFRDDFYILYSEIADFKPDTHMTWENIQPRMENQRFIFNTIGHEENSGYILVNLKKQSIKDRFLPFFIYALTGIIFICVLTVFAVCISIILTRTITNSVKVLEKTTRRIAEGELDLEVDVKGSNEIISLANSLNKMRRNLKEEELRRSRLIMGISHDLKTPLALIKGYAEAIEDGVADSKAKQTEFTEIISAKADHLESMINDLIDFVKMDSGEWREQLNKVNLSAFLQNAVKTMSMDVEVLRHELITDIVIPDNIIVSLDEKLVYRAIENLIHNAVRYTPTGSVIRFTVIPEEKGIELVISDNGMGIEKEDLPHVFEMFYRGSSSRREQGLGLGLAVVKWVIDYHGWSISVFSEKGKGTSFTISIPL